MATKVVKPPLRPGAVAARPAPPATAANARKPTPPAGAPPRPQGAPPTPVKKQEASPKTLLVHSKAKKDNIGLGTLVGEYVESGKNHGRSYFKRKPKAAGEGEAPSVFLYFWDMRDGPDFSGWWFGDKVGGSQVWSRCERPDQLPPRIGWRVPWDGAVAADLVVEPKPSDEKVEAKEEPAKEEDEVPAAAAVAPSAELDERVQRATDRVVLAEIEATQALESVHAMLEGEVTEDNLKVVEELLQAQASSLTDAHKTLAADIMDARKSSPKTVTPLNNLTPRLRSVQASLAQEMKKSREMVAKKKQEAEELKKKAKAEAAQAEAEQRDAKKLEEALPVAMEVVTTAEDSLDAVAAAASPLAVDYAEEMTESALLAIKETEAAVVKSQEAIKAAYAKITANIKAAKDYAPEAKKVALTEYSALQEKLSDVKKKLSPFERCRKSHEAKLECKKMLAEVGRKIGTVEVEVEKVTGMLAGTNPSEEDIRSAESSLPPVAQSLSGIMKVLEQRLQDAPASVKEDLQQMHERGGEAKKKLDTFRVDLRSQLDQLEVQVMLRQGLERTQAAEEALAQTAVAEAPFLKGIELTPGPEATEAVDGMKEASKVAEAKVHLAKAFLKSKLADAKRFPEAAQESIVDELGQLQSRVDVVAQRLAAFKREASARETAILLTEVTQKVADAEAKVQRTKEASAPLAPEKLEEIGVAKLKEAAEQTLEAEKMAAIACAEARKVLVAKQKDGQAKESPGYAAELVTLQGRLAAVQQELSKQRKVAVQGEKLWKSTVVLQEKEDQMRHVEAEVDKAELLTTPLGDERPSNANIMEMDRSVNAVQAILTEIVASLGTAQQVAQGTLKAQLVKLMARAKKSQGKIDEMKATTREQREKVQCQCILEEARGKLDKVDAAFMQVAEAEVPYLKGIEILPLDEATKAVADSEAAAAAVQKVIGEARTFMSAKSLEIKAFIEGVAKTGTQDMEALMQRNEEAKDKLAQFVRETEGRKRLQQEQQAQAKVQEAEEAVQRSIQAAAPLAAQSAEETSQEAAQEIVEKLGEAEQEAQEKLEEARRFLLERQRDKKSRMDSQTLSKFAGRLNSVQVDLAKAKAAASEHEQRFVAKMLLQEVGEMVKALEAELEKTTEAAAPLTVEGGKSFVVAGMARMILEALSEHCQKSKLSREQLFTQISAGASAGQVMEADFVAFLEKVPDICSRADLAFSSEQRQAVFEHLDGDKDGIVSRADFVQMFRDRFICTQEVSITDGFDLAQSKTIDTLLVDDVVESLGEQRSLDAMGLIRMEVRVLKDGTTGWVTLQGSQGSANFSPFTAYAAFIKRLDRTLSSTQANMVKTSSFVTTKSTELRECQQGPLADAKGELSVVRPKVNLLRSKLEQLQKKVEEGKREHSKREELERRMQEEKKDRKAATLVLSSVAESVEKAQGALQKLELAAAPFADVAEADLASVASPLTLQKQATEAGAAVTEAVAATRGCLKANEGRVVKAAKGPWQEARQEMFKQKQRVDAIEKKGTALLDGVRAACDRITEAKSGQVSAALRSSVQSRKISIDAFFAELAGKGKEQISEAAFGKCLDKLKGLEITKEQKQLLLQKSSPDGITRRIFFAMVERYFRCVKEIAVTSDFDIKASTTLRKLEPDEFIEVLDGPRSDSSLGVMRVRARALSDGKEGWVTAKGNQGTPFLEECGKPCYFATEALSLQDAFTTDGGGEVREVKPGEVLEVVEGPRKEVIGNAMRARGKATSDGAVGWFTVRSKQGEDTVQPGKSTLTCKQSIALTNEMSIKDCKVVRKLDKGEALVILEGPVEDEAAGVTRIRAKATKDNAEGWVTTKGNAGSVYIEESGRTYVVTVGMPLQTRFQSESASDVRALAEGETLEVLEGPKEEKSDAPARVRVRAVADGASGWVSLKKAALQLWSPSYKAVAEAELTEGLSQTSKAVRNLEPGEALELLEGPKEDAGALRLRGRAAKDGAVGWASLVGADGQALLECVPAA